MSESDQKKLMPEVLPAPVIRPKDPVRARVVKHMRETLALGTLTLITACPYAVVDPLPPPSFCADKMTTMEGVVVKATPDGAKRLKLTVEPDANWGITFSAVRNTTGAQIVSETTSASQVSLTIAPDAVPSTFTVQIPIECAPNYRSSGSETTFYVLTLTITYDGSNTPQVTISEERTEDPTADGGM